MVIEGKRHLLGLDRLLRHVPRHVLQVFKCPHRHAGVACPIENQQPGVDLQDYGNEIEIQSQLRDGGLAGDEFREMLKDVARLLRPGCQGRPGVERAALRLSPGRRDDTDPVLWSPVPIETRQAQPQIGRFYLGVQVRIVCRGQIVLLGGGM